MKEYEITASQAAKNVKTYKEKEDQRVIDEWDKKEWPNLMDQIYDASIKGKDGICIKIPPLVIRKRLHSLGFTVNLNPRGYCHVQW